MFLPNSVSKNIRRFMDLLSLYSDKGADKLSDNWEVIIKHTRPSFTPKPTPTQEEAIAGDRLPIFGVYNGLGEGCVFSDHFSVFNVKLNRLSRARST